MTIYIALLRGINVGGHKLIKMLQLKNLLMNMGLSNVKTYIQSGNVVFKSEENTVHLQHSIEEEINNVFGFSVSVILKTASEWEQIIRNCPYPVGSLPEGETVHLSLMASEPSEERIRHLLNFKSEMEECHIKDLEIYLYLRKSFHHSKMAIHLQKLGVQATIRNWKTITKIETMVNEIR